jgi:hypothetical protein
MTTSSSDNKTAKSHPAISSPDQFIKALQKGQTSFLSYSDSNVPWFETLFPDVTLPALQDLKLPKEAFAPLFTRIASRLKHIAKENGSSRPHLPKDIASRIEKVILASVIKSTDKKAPSSIIKKGLKDNHYPAVSTPIKKPSATPLKEKTTPIKTPVSQEKTKEPTPQSSTPQAHKAEKVNTKTSNSSKPATTDPKAPTLSSDKVISLLKESSSPTFYFAADKTPTFETLYPKTTRPKTTLHSGTVRVAPVDFQPLLKSRIASAHQYLRKRDAACSRLPASFMKYQTRLICRSLEQTYKVRSDKASAHKQKVKSDKKKKSLTYVPSSQETKDKLSSPSQVQQTDSSPQDEEFRRLHTLKSLITSLRDQEINTDPRLLPAIARLHDIALPFSPSTWTFVPSSKIVATPTFQESKLMSIKIYNDDDPTTMNSITLDQKAFTSISSQASAFYSSIFQ